MVANTMQTYEMAMPNGITAYALKAMRIAVRDIASGIKVKRIAVIALASICFFISTGIYLIRSI